MGFPIKMIIVISSLNLLNFGQCSKLRLSLKTLQCNYANKTFNYCLTYYWFIHTGSIWCMAIHLLN